MITEHTNKPLSFIEWKTHYEDSFEATELPKLYNSYLDDWKTKKLDKENKKNERDENYRKDKDRTRRTERTKMTEKTKNIKKIEKP